MDALFIVVAELLLIPLILWGLIVLELTVGLAGSIYAFVMGRRSPTDVVRYAWRGIRRRLLWSLIFMSSALLLADLVFFEQIVRLAVGSANEREDIEVSYSHAEGSFILGRIELHDLTLSAVRGPSEDPSTKFDVTVSELVIDIDTKRLLTASFAVEDLSLDGVRGSVERLRASEPKPKPETEGPSREFTVERMHFGDMQFEIRDHTGESLREVDIVIGELDIGPVASDSVAFDLLYRTRGRGAILGHEFSLRSEVIDGIPQTTLEVLAIPIDALAGPIEAATDVRVSGTADLVVVDRYREAESDPSIDIAVDLRLRELELEPGKNASVGTSFMVEVAEGKLAKLSSRSSGPDGGDEFSLAFEISVLRSELAGARSFSESGVLERVTDAIKDSLKAQLL
jgi:hypothetical protein